MFWAFSCNENNMSVNSYGGILLFGGPMYIKVCSLKAIGENPEITNSVEIDHSGNKIIK